MRAVEFSVIIPAYNEQSVLNRPFGEPESRLNAWVHRPWEVIFVDDGSSERTAEIISNKNAEAYDRASGQVRRYSLSEPAGRLEKHGLVIEPATDWGLSFLPAPRRRKRIPAGVKPEQVIRRGFLPGNKVVNEGMLRLSKVEPLPHRVAGTSVPVVARRKVW